MKKGAFKRFATKTKHIILGIIIAASGLVGGLFLYFSISWFVNGENEGARFFGLLVGLAGAFVFFKAIIALKNSISNSRSAGSGSESSGSESSGSASSGSSRPAPSANRPVGDSGALKREIRAALPNGGGWKVDSWRFGDVILRDIHCEVDTSSHRISISGSLEMTMPYGKGDTSDDPETEARDKFESYCASLRDRASGALNSYIDSHSGFDGSWSISTSGMGCSITGR